MQCNVGNLAELDALYAYIKKAYGGLDIVFANAGVALFKLTSEVDEAFFDSIMGVSCLQLAFEPALIHI